MTNTNPEVKDIEEILQTVYDPEFPIVDIFTLWLIYNVEVEWKIIKILMTFTTPACPMAEMIKEMIKNSIIDKYQKHSVELSISFDPMRNMDMVKDPDIKRMFE